MSFFTYYIKPSNYGEIGARDPIMIRPSDVDTTSTTLHLPGQGKTNYGEFYNQNLFKLLEHFSNAYPPIHPTIGQIWYQPYLIVQVSDPVILSQAPANPICGQYWTPTTPDCVYVNQYCDLSYCGTDYIDSLNCIQNPCVYINQYCDLTYCDIDYLQTLHCVVSNNDVICTYNNQYCDLTYCSDTYLESLTCIPVVHPLVQHNELMWDCKVNAWVKRIYVEKLRIYTGTDISSDPDYPGWMVITTQNTR